MTFQNWNLDHAAKTITIVAAASYALGLLVTNAYLFDLGVSEFSLFRARFVMTGLVLVAVLAVSMSVLFLPWFLFRGRKDLAKSAADLARSFQLSQGENIEEADQPPESQRSRRRRGRSAFEISIPTVSEVVWGSILFLFLGWIGASFLVRGDGFKGLLLLLFAGIAGYAVLFAAWFIGNIALGADWPFNLGGVLIGVAVVGFALIGFVTWYSHNVYPDIPEQFGGARARSIRIAFTEETRTEVEELGLRFCPGSGNASKDIDLLFEGEDFYLVATRPTDPPEADCKDSTATCTSDPSTVESVRSVIRINKDSVVAILLNVAPTGVC